MSFSLCNKFPSGSLNVYYLGAEKILNEAGDTLRMKQFHLETYTANSLCDF